MKVLLIASPTQQAEITMQMMQDGIELSVVQELIDVPAVVYDFCIDLLYVSEPNRVAQLKETGAKQFIVNYVNGTLADLPEGFTRINGWNSFLQRKIVEACTRNEDSKADVEGLFKLFNKDVEWLPDIIGFVSCRVISQIINEAYFSLDEKVSTKAEIDVAMKLGTNYPFGPFEWAEKIGIKNIRELLIKLSATEQRYQPASLLIRESE